MRFARTTVAIAAFCIASRAVAADPIVYDVRLAVDVPVTVAGFAIASLPYVLEDVVPHRCPCDPAELNGLDHRWWDRHSDAAARASDVTLVLAVAAPPVVDVALLGLGPAIRADANVYAETLAVNSALVTGAKYAFHRPRPRTYQGDPKLLDSDEGYASFYSGHTSTVVAALTAGAWTARWRYGEQGWPWALVGLGGASVAVERVLAGQHFATDVLAATLMGFAVGTAVPWFHRRSGESGVVITPIAGGLSVSGRF
jgi:membrane-associated phospholipid phosphatase